MSCFMRGPQYNITMWLDVWRLLLPTLLPEMSSFADYMDYTWIGTSLRAPLSNQWSWNQWDATLLGIPRSSNFAEGWHNGFKSLVGCSHPTIWEFLEALKLEQAIIDTKFCNHLMRNPPPPRQKKWVQLDARLQDVMDHYDD